MLTPCYSNDGFSYLVDWDEITRICQSFARSGAMLRYGSTKTSDPLWGPKLVTLDVDWAKVRSEGEGEGKRKAAAIAQKAASSGEQAARELSSYIATTRSNTEAFRALQESCSNQSMDSANAWLKFAENGESVARFLRDSSAKSLLVVGSAVATGGVGTALAFAGAGSLMTGVGTFQDSGGNTQAAAYDAASTFAFAVADIVLKGNAKGLGKAATGRLEFFLAAAEAGNEGIKAALSGESMESAVVKVAGSALGSAAASSALFTAGALTRKALPVGVRMTRQLSGSQLRNLAILGMREAAKSAPLALASAAYEAASGNSARPAKGLPCEIGLCGIPPASRVGEAVFVRWEPLTSQAGRLYTPAPEVLVSKPR